MTDSDAAAPADPAGPVSPPPAPASAQPQTVVVENPTNLLPPAVRESPSPADTGAAEDRESVPGPAEAVGDAGRTRSKGAKRARSPKGAGASEKEGARALAESPGSADAADEAGAAIRAAGSAGEAEEPSDAGNPSGGGNPPGAGNIDRPSAADRRGQWTVAAATAVAVAVAGGATVLAFTLPAKEPPPGPRSPATAGAACLVGTWRSTQLRIGADVATGTETLTFRGDGTGVDTLERITFTSGDGHTHMYDGTLMFDYVAATAIINTTAPTGTLIDRDLTAETTKTETPAYAPKNFTCSPGSLTLTNGPDESRFTRK